VRAERPAAPRGSARIPWLLGALVAVATLATFLPTIWNDFVDWDDPRMFLNNPGHRGPFLTEIWYAWSSHLLGEFMPVTWMSYALDRLFWGLHAPGYHLTSVLLHALAAVAVYALARRLLGFALGVDPPGRHAIDLGAAAAALLFALHPLRVEAVAWVSARGTVLGGLLLILSVLAYVKGWERGHTSGRVPARWLAGSALLFVASLLARATGLVLPAVLAVLDVYPLRRVGWPPVGWWSPAARRVWGEKAAFVVIGLLGTPMGFLARGEEVGDFHRAGWDPLVSLAWGAYTTGFYVWKTIGIGTLSPIYPMPTREDMMLGAVLLSAGTAVAVTAILIATRRRWPGALAAWVAYLILIGPMSGLVPFGRLRGVVDRYTYVACVGWAVVAGGALVIGWRGWRDGRVGGLRVSLLGGAVVAILLAWSALSWRQAAVWQDGVTLWRRALLTVPESPLVRSNLGTALAKRRDYAGAAAQYREATLRWRDEPGAFQNLGRALAADERFAEAVAPFRRLVELRPGSVEAHLDLGTALYNVGETREAAAAFARAVELDPSSVRAHESLGTALWRQGRQAEAAEHFRRAAALGSSTARDHDLAVPRPGADAPGGS
jgi:protein O-mannosyl-transferase